MADPMASEPLLSRPRDGSERSSLSQHCEDVRAHVTSSMKVLRAEGRRTLSSRSKHYFTMSLVALDIAALLLNIFIQLIACEMHQGEEPWVRQLSEGLKISGLIFSCVFMVELFACLFSFGPSYLTSWFHIFDSVVIILSLVVDVATRGFVAKIGALVVALRLWRLAKLSEEIVAGASERIDDLEQRNQELSDENKDLRGQLGLASD